MLALAQCWFTRTHVPAHAGRKDAKGVWRSECRHRQRAIVSWDRESWHIAAGFNLLAVEHEIHAPFLYLVDARDELVVARFPIDHLATEAEIEDLAAKIGGEHGLDEPGCFLVLRDSRKGIMHKRPPRSRKPARAKPKAARAEAPAAAPEPEPPAAAPPPPRDTCRITGLPGRTCFEQVFDEQCQRARDRSRPLSVAFCDIDGLDRVNRNAGLESGDELIRMLAEKLAFIPDCVRHISRNRGLEFILLFPFPAKQVIPMLERIRSQIAAARALDGADEENAAFSAGIADVPTHGEARLALRAADLALLRAKAAGGNRVELGEA